MQKLNFQFHEEKYPTAMIFYLLILKIVPIGSGLEKRNQ